MSVANCPSCGAPIEFAIGSSAVVICSYCRSVVARTDRGVEAHGKVAALIDTGSPLRIGVTGKYRGTGFRITGRTQMRHPAGGYWDEWYAAFDDGRWGWLAEAQGRFYVTFRVQAEAPPVTQLELGQPVQGMAGVVVAEIAEAEILSGEGELPWRPEPGARYEYADLTGEEQRFATIDYGEDPPVVFAGYEVTLAELGIAGEALRPTRVQATALNCSNCGGALDLIAPDQAERVYCPNCGAGHDVEQGKLKFFALLKKRRVEPRIPLGTTGTIDGDPFIVAGFMQRSVHFDQTYYWTEYLLYSREKGYRWLVHSDDHWSFVTPLRPGEVFDTATGAYVPKSVRYGGRNYRLFQDAPAKVTYVLGEFYWRVEVGERVMTADYVAPPYGISKEVTTGDAREVTYSHARYMTPREVERAFHVDDLPRPTTIGPMQPQAASGMGKAWAVMVALLILTAIFVAFRQPNRLALRQAYDMAGPQTQEGPNGRVLFTQPFDLSGAYNVAVLSEAAVSNSWLYVTADLVNETTGALQTFELPIEFYSGVDGGERWSEGSRERKVYLPPPERGRYVLRLEAQWENGHVPPPLNIEVREGVFRWPYFLAALIGVTILPAIALFRYVKFESERWKDSAHSPWTAVTSDDDEE